MYFTALESLHEERCTSTTAHVLSPAKYVVLDHKYLICDVDHHSQDHREVSPMCTKGVVERCFAVPLISAIGRGYLPREIDYVKSKLYIFYITW